MDETESAGTPDGRLDCKSAGTPDGIFAINNVALKKQKQSMKDALPFRATWRF